MIKESVKKSILLKNWKDLLWGWAMWKSYLKQNEGEISHSLGTRKAGIITIKMMHRAYKANKKHQSKLILEFHKE